MFCPVKKIQKIRENSEVGGWVKSQFGFLIFLKFCVFCFFGVLFLCFQMFQKINRKIDMGLGGWGLSNPSFSDFLDFF